MKKLYSLVMALVVFLSACSTKSASLEGNWKLVSYGDATNPTPAIPEIRTSISFEAKKFGGMVGCNSFGGEYKITDNKITFSNVFATEMFCETVADQETTILNILIYQTLDIEINGNQLTLTSVDGSSVIILERIEL